LVEQLRFDTRLNTELKNFNYVTWRARCIFLSLLFGDARGFVFSLAPAAAVYRATGHNQHFAWCASGFTSDRFPNGLGFGGRLTKITFLCFCPFNMTNEQSA